MLQLAPVECRPRSALMHWESLRGLGMSLGDVVAVWAEETVATPLLLSVWASGAVAVGRVGLSEEARAALGPVSCKKRGKIVMKLYVVLEDESAFKRPRIRQVIYHS